MSPGLVQAEYVRDPSWLYGGYYPDSPKQMFKIVAKSIGVVWVEVRIEVDGATLQRTLHFSQHGANWVVDSVTLNEPEHRELP